MVKAVFVTGTDTEIGKTFVSAIFTKAWDANYWKPIQTGLNCDIGDTKTVKTLTQLPENRFAAPQVELEFPLSPWRAAFHENKPLPQVADIQIPQKFLNSELPLVLEGAGGLFVPINDKEITTDLIKKLDVPVILVARSQLGTINHTLLSIEHLQAHGVSQIFIVLNGPLDADNAAAIEHFSKGVKVIAQIPPCKKDINESVGLIPSLDSLLK